MDFRHCQPHPQDVGCARKNHLAHCVKLPRKPRHSRDAEIAHADDNQGDEDKSANELGEELDILHDSI